VEWLGDFFRALPQALQALWRFGDGFYGLAVMLGYAGLALLFVFLALKLRPTRGWLSSIFGIMAATIGFFWGFGILPSAWVYFADGHRELLEGTVIPSALPGAENFYEVFRDSVVMVLTGLGVAGFCLAALAIQRRYPRALVEGEEAGPRTGGYK
jgi:hypothetical protein